MGDSSMRHETPASTEWLTIILCGLMTVVFWSDFVWADTPMQTYLNTKCSISGQYCVTSDPIAGTYVHLADQPHEPIWQITGWFHVMYLSDDGDHLVTGYSGLNLIPIQALERTDVVRFWYRGKELESYTLQDLGYQGATLPRTTSHYHWGSYLGFDDQGHFCMLMFDGTVISFTLTYSHD